MTVEMEGSQIPVKRLPDRLAGGRGLTSFQRDVRLAIEAMQRPAIVFDLPAAATLDSDAIDFLIWCALDAVGRDAQVALAAANAEHRTVLEMTRLSSIMPTFPSIDEAVLHLQKTGCHSAGNF